MVKRLERIYLSPETKRLAKIKASEESMSLKAWLDQVVLEKAEKKKTKGDDYRFF